MTIYDDTYYVNQVREGDTDAFGHLVRKYQCMVFTTAAKITGSHHDAEDITQEIFIKVFASLGKFKGDAGFSTWLYRIAYNTTISEIRRRRRDLIRIDESLPDTEIDPGMDEVDACRRTEILETVIRSLDPEDAQLVMMYYYNKLPIKDIGVISGLSLSNVKVKLHRIRNYISIEINKVLADGRD